MASDPGRNLWGHNRHGGHLGLRLHPLGPRGQFGCPVCRGGGGDREPFWSSRLPAHSTFVPNDPDYNNASIVYGPQQINAPAAWDITLGDPNLILAVMDTGIDLTHPEFAGRLLPGYDFVNDDADPTDDNGHGTHVAGIVAAGIDNAFGIAGMAGRVKILPVKVLNASNMGWWSDVAAGITCAVDNGARVINLSLAGTAESLAVRDAITYAVSKDVVVMVAAGNDNSAVARYPAVYDNVIAVGATTYTSVRWILSNYGPNLDVMAPGAMVWSARPGSAYPVYERHLHGRPPHARAGRPAAQRQPQPDPDPDQDALAEHGHGHGRSRRGHPVRLRPDRCRGGLGQHSPGGL